MNLGVDETDGEQETLSQREKENYLLRGTWNDK